MACNYCKHEEAYDVSRMEPHLAMCEKYIQAQATFAKRRELLSSLIDDPLDTSTSLDQLVLKLETEFDHIRTDRFQRVPIMRQRLLSDWMEFWQQYQEWRSAAQARISRLEGTGSRNAQRLAEALLAESLDYGNFQLVYPVPVGEEIVSIQLSTSDKYKTRRQGTVEGRDSPWLTETPDPDGSTTSRYTSETPDPEGPAASRGAFTMPPRSPRASRLVTELRPPGTGPLRHSLRNIGLSWRHCRRNSTSPGLSTSQG